MPGGIAMELPTPCWLIPLLATMSPLSSHGDHAPSPLQLPKISSCARRRCSAFIHPSLAHKQKIHNCHHDFQRRFIPSSNIIIAAPHANICAGTQLGMSSSSPVPSSSQRSSPSPWSPGEWKITLDFGKEDSDSSSSSDIPIDNSKLSTLLGEEWGSNGSRLSLSFEVLANAETNIKEDETSVQMAWLGGKPTGTIECFSEESTDGDGDDEEDYCASYINIKGKQKVQIASGQWRNEPPLPLLPTYSKILSGQASTLRCYLTLLTSIQRNTIQFPENQLILLQSNTFRTQQYASGFQTLLPYQYAKDMSQEALETQLNHETGDRRLDGTDLFETLGGYKDIAELVLERDKTRGKWKEVEGALPNNNVDTSGGKGAEIINALLEDENRWGIWPGDTEFMTVERGVILAVVAKKEGKQKNGGLFPWMQDGGGVEEPVVVGTWSASPILYDEDDYN